jgi:CRP-like cAMP-binding protein
MVLGKGKTFGDIALTHNTKRTASIMAQEPTELIVLSKDVF